MIRVDSHFHPNFSFLLPERFRRRRAARIWRAFARHKLDVVFVCEHSYKRPARSFDCLRKYRPADAMTMLVPAVEALTKEGMDVIVFSRDEHVYTCKDILTPRRLSMDALLRRVCADRRLFAVIPHPFIPCSTGLIHHRTREETRDCIRRAHFVEKYNASLRPLDALIGHLGLRHIFRKTLRRLRQTADVPAAMIDKGVIIFGGSDAHHWWDIGTHLVIHADRPRSAAALFSIVTRDTHPRRIVWQKRGVSLCIPCLFDVVVVFLENMRKKLRLWQIDLSAARPSFR